MTKSVKMFFGPTGFCKTCGGTTHQEIYEDNTSLIICMDCKAVQPVGLDKGPLQVTVSEGKPEWRIA